MDESSAGSASTGSSSNATTGASNLLLTKGFQIRRRAFVNQFLRKRLRVKDANDAKASFAQRPSGGAKGQAAASSRATSRRPAPLAAPRIGASHALQLLFINARGLKQTRLLRRRRVRVLKVLRARQPRL
mmetsp:Transcript_31067/g.107368  ORF Transcript_31067/g.107368 Transcript_31067/m.107368 type:complete len:130 (-) Transcript_31067:294-683(-)